MCFCKFWGGEDNKITVIASECVFLPPAVLLIIMHGKPLYLMILIVAMMIDGTCQRAYDLSNTCTCTDPCSSITPMTCGTFYTATLNPNSSAWTNYTGI